MDWPLPSRNDVDVVSAGVLTQWRPLWGPPPPLLELMGWVPGWTLAFVQARGWARHDTAARHLLDGFERELARISGHAPLPPNTANGFVSKRGPTLDIDPRSLDLPRLDPTRHLLVTGGLVGQPVALAFTAMTLLAAAFGPGPGCMSVTDDQRLRLLEPMVPQAWRARWQAAEGLELAAPYITAEHAAAGALVEHSFLQAHRANPVPLREAVRPALALDLVLAGLTLELTAAASSERHVCGLVAA